MDYSVVFNELDRIQAGENYNHKLKTTINHSEEIKELQKLSEEIKRPHYVVTSSS